MGRRAARPFALSTTPRGPLGAPGAREDQRDRPSCSSVVRGAGWRAVANRTALAAALGVLGACGGGSGADERVDAALAAMPIEARIAQLIAQPVALPSPAAAEEVVRSHSRHPAGRAPGTLWIDSATARGLATLGRGLDGTELPTLIGAYLDGGVGGVVRGATPVALTPPPMADADGAFPTSATSAGGRVGEEARLLGISLGVLSGPPLLGTPDSTFAGGNVGYEDRLRDLFAAAAEAGPALGLRLFWSPDTSPLAATWDRARIDALELAALRAVADTDLAAIMIGNASLPAISGDSVPLALSPAAIEGLLRRDEGWEGVVIVDLRDATPPSTTPYDAAIRSLAAGADLLITGLGPPALIDSIAAAIDSGRLTTARIDDAARRILALKLGRAPAPTLHPDSIDAGLLALQTVAPAPLPGSGPTIGANPDSAVVSPGFLVEVDAEEAGMSEAALARADRLILEAIEDEAFGAAALAVGRGGRLVRLRGYGKVGPDGPPVDPRTTIFDIASLTKVVGTTTAAAILIERGAIELDEPVRTYIPDFRGEGRDEVTLRHLLTHTSGLPSGLWLYGSADSRAEAIAQVIAQPLVRPPGEAPEYSDLGMILLAEVVEGVTEEPIDRFLARNLFVPLGMSSTMYLPPTPLHDRIVPTAIVTERPYPLRGVVHDGNAFRLQGVAGHAGLFSTAADLAVFTRMMLSGGHFDSIRILADSTVSAITDRQEGAEERAIGWDTPADRSSAGRYFSAGAYGHTGYTGTSIWVDPDRDLFVVLLTNRTYPEATASAILDVRIDVHETIARAITDETIARRPGSR